MPLAPVPPPIVASKLTVIPSVGRARAETAEPASKAVVELSLEVSDPVICHGDFHPNNVLVEGARFGVIDWSTAGVGDRHADLAWTAHAFEVAARSAEVEGVPELLRGFARSLIAAYEARHHIEPERLALWRPVNLLLDLAMIVAEGNGLWGTGASTGGSPRDRQEEVRQEFEAAMRLV